MCNWPNQLEQLVCQKRSSDLTPPPEDSPVKPIQNVVHRQHECPRIKNAGSRSTTPSHGSPDCHVVVHGSVGLVSLDSPLSQVLNIGCRELASLLHLA